MKRTILSILLLAAVVLAGCNPQATTQTSQSQTFVMANNTFAAVVQELTTLQKLGAFNQTQTDNITVLIHQGQTCLNQWHASLVDTSLPPYSGFDCLNSTMINLLSYANQGVKK
jgi:hypothetical protein